MCRFKNAELKLDSESESELELEVESKSDTELMVKLKSSSYVESLRVKNLVTMLSKSKHILLHKIFIFS